MTGQDEFSERMMIDADLDMWLAEQVWNHGRVFRLGGHEFECVGCDEVPGYEDEDHAVLLRRKSDGKVFEAEFDVSVRPVREVIQP